MPSIRHLASTAFFLLCLALPSFAQLPEAGGKSLADLRGKNRVLLVFAPSEKDPSYQEQMKLWQNEKAGFTERDLVLLPVLVESKKEGAETPELLRRRYKVNSQAFQIILIGKDGHDAYSADKPTPAEALYSRIDAMPMRRDEMQKKKARE